MNLFNENAIENILPYDGNVSYIENIITVNEITKYYNALLDTIKWKNDEAIIYGKHIVTKRQVAWYADQNFSYTYSNITKHALLWTIELLELKQKIERCTSELFNSCLLNLYSTGSEGMSWHSDAEKELKKNGTIASLSIGAERKFSFKHKITKQVISLTLKSGSLLIMRDTTQTNWLHCLPVSKKINSPRVNLTFRQMQSI